MRKVTSNTGPGINPNEFRPVDYIKITIFGFALAALWGSLHTVVLQVWLLDFVPESEKATHLSILMGVGLLLAMVVQPIAGAISDRSGFSWGRRRPYILAGTILAVLLISGMGFCGSYTALFIIYCLLQISVNTAIGPYQGFIPDLVPRGKWGRASGVKSLLEIVGGITLIYPIALFMDRYSAGQEVSWLWLALGALAIVVLGTMLATVLTVKERPGTGGSQLPLLPTLYKSFRIDVKASPGFIWFLVSRLLILIAFTTLRTFALYFLKDVVGVADPAAAAARFSIVAVAGMLTLVYPAGLLSDKIGRQPIAISSGLFAALGILLIFLFQHSYMAIMVCGGLIGISFGAFLSTNWALATDLVPRGEEAKYLGLTNLATAGGSALTLFIIGPMIDFFNASSPGLGYQAMFLACFIFLVAGSLLVLKIKRRRLTEVG